MIAINDIKQQAKQTGITTYEVYTSASQALTTQDELINVGVGVFLYLIKRFLKLPAI